MELDWDIHEMFKPSFLKYSVKSLMPLDIPPWKTNTGQERLSFFGPKTWSKIHSSDCSDIPTHKQLVSKRTLN